MSDDDDDVMSASDDDVKYTIGTIVVDDGTEEYEEMDDEQAESEGDEEQAGYVPDQKDESGDKDDFLDDVSFDPDDPDRYWGK